MTVGRAGLRSPVASDLAIDPKAATTARADQAPATATEATAAEMEIRADFSKPVFVTTADYQWVPSPMPGVERMMLDRLGEEVARATSLVRYAPGSTFSAHTHGGGEEIYVLDGAFGDEHGLYPAGTYLRNPIGSSHTPQIGESGALILVKLHQFATTDTRQCVLPNASGQLHSHGSTSVSIETLQGRQPTDRGGDEVFILSGSIKVLGRAFNQGDWARLPASPSETHWTGDDARVLRTRGHLTGRIDTPSG